MYEDFIKIYDEYKNDIYRLAFSYLQNKYDSEDVVQNVYVKLYKKFNKLDRSNIKPWLIRVTINECKNLLISCWYRKTKFISAKEENTIMVDTGNNQEFWQEFMNLSSKSRVILHLYYYENYSLKEIAQMLHITESNAKVRLFRSRKELKSILMEEGYEK